jgi:hypothetical protein
MIGSSLIEARRSQPSRVSPALVTGDCCAPLPHRFGSAARGRVWVADPKLIPCQGDGAFGLRSHLVGKHAALVANDEGRARLIHGPGAKCSSGSVHRRSVFLWCAFQTVVDFEVGSVRMHDDLSLMSIGGEYENAFRIRTEELSLRAIRRHVVVGDNRPGSNQLFFERFLLSCCKAAAENDARAQHHAGHYPEYGTAIHVFLPDLACHTHKHTRPRAT